MTPQRDPIEPDTKDWALAHGTAVAIYHLHDIVHHAHDVDHG